MLSKKKIFTVFISLVLVLAMTVPAFAVTDFDIGEPVKDTVDVFIEDTEIDPGTNTASLTVRIKNNPGFWALKFGILYKDYLSVADGTGELVSFSVPSAEDGGAGIPEEQLNFGTPDLKKGSIYAVKNLLSENGLDVKTLGHSIFDEGYCLNIVYTECKNGTDNFTDDGIIFSYNLKYNPGLNRENDTESEIILLPSKDDAIRSAPGFLDGESIGLRCYNGKVKLPAGDYVAGDANGDGVADIKDVFLIRQYIAGNASAEDMVFNAADVDGDGDVNIKDVFLIRQYIAGAIDKL